MMFEYIFGIDKGAGTILIKVSVPFLGLIKVLVPARFWRDYYYKVVFLVGFSEAIVFLVDPY